MMSINKILTVLFASSLVCTSMSFVQAQTITSVKLSPNSDNSPASDLSVIINGLQKTVTSRAFTAWIVEGGRAILWSSPDGAGGFENEGQSLWRYDAKTAQKRRLAAEYFEINNVREVKSATGKAALFLSMSDGGLGGPHLALVDPKRGIVWREQMARLTAIRNGRFAIGTVTEDAVNYADAQTAKISRTLYFDIDKLLKKPVITLPPVG